LNGNTANERSSVASKLSVKYTNKTLSDKTMASPTVKIIKMRIPKTGETSSDSGSYAKACSDAIGNTTAALTKTDSVRMGDYMVTTIYLFSA
jgi:hypothetical protein